MAIKLLKEREIQIALITGCFAILAAVVGALVINTGLGRVSETLSGNQKENIQFATQAVPGKENLVVVAHNFGGGSGTVIPTVTIVVRDGRGEESKRHNVELNEGVSGYRDPGAFTLKSGEGKRYYVKMPKLSDESMSCKLEFRVTHALGGEDVRTTPPFDC